MRRPTARLLSILPLVTAVLVPATTHAQPGGTPLDPGALFTSELDLESLPGGGFLGVWQRDAAQAQASGPDVCVHQQAVGALFDARGQLVEAPRAIAFPEGGGSPDELALAVTPAGQSGYDAVLAWSTGNGLWVGKLNPDFELLGSTSVSTCTIERFDLVSSGAALNFWLVWSETCDGHRIRGRILDVDGAPLAPAITLVEDGLAGPAHGFAASGTFDAGFFLTWVEREAPGGGGGRRVVASHFGADGTPDAPIRTLSESLADPDLPGDSLAATTFQIDTAAFAWRGAEGVIRLATFDGAMSPLADATPVADGPAARGFSPLFPGDYHFPILVAWDPSLGGAGVGCPARSFDSGLRGLTQPAPLGPDCDRPVALAVERREGLPVAAWERSDLPASACAVTRIGRAPGLVLPLLQPVGSLEVPDFVFYVRIGGDGPGARIGMPEPDCLPETVCASGALPGRTEVLMRVVGPKLNGFLWPTIVRFTTSEVEVWVQQLRTGRFRYYRLEGSTPGSEELDGLFDRNGFPP